MENYPCYLFWSGALADISFLIQPVDAFQYCFCIESKKKKVKSYMYIKDSDEFKLVNSFTGLTHLTDRLICFKKR